MIARNASIPRQLMLLIGMAVVAMLAAAVFYYFACSRMFKDSAAMTTEAMARLDNSYDLLQRISGDLNSLQQLLRLDDPDAIDKARQELAASQEQSLNSLGGGGLAAAGIKAGFDKLVAQEKGIVELFLKGQNAQANEQFLQVVTPQSSAVLEEIRKYHQAVQTGARQELAATQNRIQSQLRWQVTVSGVVLACLGMAGWLLKNRITRKLLEVVSELEKVSQTSASSAGQVSAASQSLAEGASEQAASLEETSSSLEEMSSMTKRNAESAQKANELARQARDAADKGVSGHAGHVRGHGSHQGLQRRHCQDHQDH